MQDHTEKERGHVLDIALTHAIFDGWTTDVLDRAIKEAGIEAARRKILFPRGVIDLLQFWSERADQAAVQRFSDEDLAAMRIRDKIEGMILARISYLDPSKEAARRAAAFLALPHNTANASKLTWRTADALWVRLGDRSNDFNYYSKRTILSGVWLSSFAYWMTDDTPDYKNTRTFVAERIENVMTFEKLKSKTKGLSEFLAAGIKTAAKMRYAGR